MVTKERFIYFKLHINTKYTMKSLKGLLTYVLLPLAAFQLGLAPIKTELIKTDSFDKKITKVLNAYEEHRIRDIEASKIPKDVTETKVNIKGQDVRIKIHGFEGLGCNKCHSAKEINDSMKYKIEKGLDLIKEHYNDAIDEKSVIPEVINIRPFVTGETTLSDRSLADTILEERKINIHVSTLLFEKLFLNDGITAHEMMHTSQIPGTQLAEQDTYFLNATQNSVHMVENPIMNTLKDVMANFVDPTIIKSFEEVKNMPVYKRVEHLAKNDLIFTYIKNISPETDAKLKQTIKKLKPLFIEAFKERRKHRLEWDYLYRSHAVENIGLEVIAAKNYEPKTKIDQKKLEEGIEILSKLYEEKDFIKKTLLGFYLHFGFVGSYEGLKEIAKETLKEKGYSYEEALNVYFSYLKKEFVTKEGEINYTKIRQKIEDNPKFIDEKIYSLEQKIGKPWTTKKGEKRINEQIQELRKILPEDYIRDLEDFGISGD